MKLQIGSIVMNKTKKYLIPCIKEYGERFEKEIVSVDRVAYGIGDIITVKSGVRFEKHLFILVDTTSKFSARSFNRMITWLREQEMYEDDYVFDDIRDGHLHMIVIKLPEKHYHTFETFKMGQFSKMYTQKDVERFFSNKPDIKRVLIKEHSYRIEFVKSLNKKYGSTVSPEEFEGELDMPIRREEEEFNRHLLKTNKKQSHEQAH